MPTLGEACQLLRVSRRTLDKWLERLKITPTRHAWDYRFYEITSDELEQIADARRKLPGHVTGAFIPSSSPLAFDRSSTRETVASEASPTVRPAPRQRPLRAQASETLAEGWMSQKRAADVHGIPYQTVRAWCGAGRIETDSGEYGGEHGHWRIARPLTRRGLAQLVVLASGRPDFVPCEQCPHAEAE